MVTAKKAEPIAAARITQQVWNQVLRRIRAQSDRNRDGAGTDCQGKRQRVERLLRASAQVTVRLAEP